MESAQNGNKFQDVRNTDADKFWTNRVRIGAKLTQINNNM
jgi:hypothetical protein